MDTRSYLAVDQKVVFGPNKTADILWDDDNEEFVFTIKGVEVISVSANGISTPSPLSIITEQILATEMVNLPIGKQSTEEAVCVTFANDESTLPSMEGQYMGSYSANIETLILNRTNLLAVNANKQIAVGGFQRVVGNTGRIHINQLTVSISAPNGTAIFFPRVVFQILRGAVIANPTPVPTPVVTSVDPGLILTAWDLAEEGRSWPFHIQSSHYEVFSVCLSGNSSQTVPLSLTIPVDDTDAYTVAVSGEGYNFHVNWGINFTFDGVTS